LAGLQRAGHREAPCERAVFVKKRCGSGDHGRADCCADHHYGIAAQWDDVSQVSGGGPRKSGASVLAGYRSLPPSASIWIARPKATSHGSTAALFNLLAPDLHKVHPLNGWSPQDAPKSQRIFFKAFVRFDLSCSIVREMARPSWAHFGLSVSQRFLQHLQHQNGRQRWILKSPDHVFALGALRSTYPDARIVFMHRDPIKVLPSNAQLIEILRAPFTQKIDRFQIGRQIMTDLALGAANMIETSQLGRFPSAQVFHLHYLDLVSRPLDAIARLYRHFGLSIKALAMERMSRKIAARPNGGYAKNIYSPVRHGIDPMS
jgi:hypothetical protein